MSWEDRRHPERTIGLRVQGLRPTLHDSLVGYALASVAGAFVASLVALPLGLHLGLADCPHTRNPGVAPGVVGPSVEEAVETPAEGAPHTTPNLTLEADHVN